MILYDPFNDWLHSLSYLTYEQTMSLPPWKRTISFIEQLLVTHLNDGAGSLFYNDPGLIAPITAELRSIGELELADLVLEVADMLMPTLKEDTEESQRIVLQAVRREPVKSMVHSLDDLIERRFGHIREKSRVSADANGWQG